MEEFYHPRTVWVPLGILLGSGTLFAVLTLQWQRCFVTLSTATFGSAIITVTVDYFIELFALVHYVYERLRVGSSVCFCVNSYWRREINSLNLFEVTLRRVFILCVRNLHESCVPGVRYWTVCVGQGLSCLCL